MQADTPPQLTSLRNVELFAAEALLAPSLRPQLTYARLIIRSGMRWAIGAVSRMFDWFEAVGYGVEVAALRAAEPRLQDFETWLRENSEFPFSRGGAGEGLKGF
ncbi:hypothetical protein DL766_007327 [Monosporascus sp. MC13-8B]|uniref:Uncharacterized protein n=1 Tax=Monosporascus cannonballus TaxID=155416 RepID=A0ABY0GRC7_9PEZI|nr:hypothetical protein DL763_010288 [Monosporascus cannonballus]RYO75114.1 hypothetical protein DL762_010167 [Monosporascus cannonballus]RYP24255.1 hypothetical protein DL766_007327 [Monosporascus sp. MC13-8B]